ncbi:hypothetical protein VNI00_004928 [Paramarasmius palmivorus]|uniref:Uncharacterized protein n=1 Tax=Paramarasmius palmivorus TaxID=297713 RepID=A0AAW0DL53_9AGAR
MPGTTLESLNPPYLATMDIFTPLSILPITAILQVALVVVQANQDQDQDPQLVWRFQFNYTKLPFICSSILFEIALHIVLLYPLSNALIIWTHIHMLPLSLIFGV